MLKKSAKIVCEPQALENHPGIFCQYGHKALVVTGPHVGRSTMMSRLAKALERDGIEYEVFDGITGEPTDIMIEAGVKVYKDSGCEFCVGIGGGSPLDSAKAIAAMTVNSGKIADYNGKEMSVITPPVVCIPTTAGTGSETTRFTIITDTCNGIKMLLKGDALLPVLAIDDYTMSMEAPQSVTAATGLDALTHAVESFISIKATPETDELAIDAVKRIMKYLPVAYLDGSNAKAREEMTIAALKAGICINNSSVTIVHGMSRPIGALFHVPHGISNAMLLVTCMADMLECAREKFAILGRAIGVACEKDEDSVAASAFIEALGNICRVCQVPTLQGYGIDEAQYLNSIDKMASDAIASGSPGNAPCRYDVEDCKRLYKIAYK